MNKKLKHDGRPKRSICEQSAYTSNLIVYTNYSDILELDEIRPLVLMKFYTRERNK